jgi:hypothetical protein
LYIAGGFAVQQGKIATTKAERYEQDFVTGRFVSFTRLLIKQDNAIKMNCPPGMKRGVRGNIVDKGDGK